MSAETASTQPPTSGQQAPTPDEVGRQTFEDLGVSPDDQDRLSRLLLNAGGQCVGTLTEFLGQEEHVRVRDKVVDTVKKAQETKADVFEAVTDKLDFFIERDADDKPVLRAPEAAPDQKKN